MPDKRIKRLATQRTKLIDNIISALEKKLGTGEQYILKYVITEFVDKLDKDGEKIANTLRNKRLVGLIDTLYNRFASGDGQEAVKAIADGIIQIIDFNANYFGTFSSPAAIGAIKKQVKQAVSAWLGITERGAIATNGYLDTIVKDATIRNQIKNIVIGSIIGQKGYRELKQELSDYVAGDGKTEGALKKYYRNFVYDTFSVADRTAAKIFADKLKLNFAIYEGGLIKTSREFCRKRNGKVFSREEISKFDPPTAKQPGYNPFTDLGGYGCRHHLNWIPDSVAFALRPELRNYKPAA